MCRFNKIIKKFLILRAKPVDIFLERSISVAEEKIAIKDEIVNNSGLKILSREKVNNFSARHVPSSRFFRMNDFLFMPSNEDEICVDFQNYDQ